MIVVAIVGTAVTLALPNYMIWYSTYQLRQAITEVNSQLGMSRLSAMTRNSAVTTTVVLSAGQLTMTATDAAGGTVYQQVSSLPRVSAVTFLSGTNFQFSPLGLRTSGPAGDQVVRLDNDKGLQYSVRVTQGGKASWCPKSTCP